MHIEGRRICTKSLSYAETDDSQAAHQTNAITGSRLLRDAIFRARGYIVPKPDPVPMPAFKRAKPKGRGRPSGPSKVRTMTPRVARIITLAAEHYKVPASELMAFNRCANVVKARQVAMYVVRQVTGASYPDLGFYFGGKDHTTAIYSVGEVGRRIAQVDHPTLAALHSIHARM